MATPNPCAACDATLAGCNISEEARCRIAHGEDPARVAHVVFVQGLTGYLSESVPGPAPTPFYHTLAEFAGTTH